MSSMPPQIKANGINSDISDNAHGLARAIDRLPSGRTYIVQVIKNELIQIGWKVDIVQLKDDEDHVEWKQEIPRSEFIRSMILRKNNGYVPE